MGANGHLHKELKRFMDTDGFRRAVEEYKAESTTTRVTKKGTWWYREIERIIRDHRDLAVQQLRTQDAEFDTAIIQSGLDSVSGRIQDGVQDLIDIPN